MATTSEGHIKSLVKALLHAHDVMPASKVAKGTYSQGWYYMPVQNGMGVSGIPDFIICFRGRFIAVETKAPGKKPTRFQELQLSAVSAAGGAALVVDSEAAIILLQEALCR